MKRTTKNWFAASNYDIETAKHLLKTKRYIYVIFMCHLATEKMLKAIIAELQEELPPKTHNLLYLARLAKLEIPPEHQTIIKHLNTVSVPTRYPEEMEKIPKEFNQTLATEYFKETEKFFKWLRTHPKLRE